MGTKIQILYGNSITILANNHIQGKQTYSIVGKTKLSGISQFHGAFRSLPLAQGMNFNLGFFDLSVQSQFIRLDERLIERRLIYPEIIQASINIEEEIMVKNPQAFKIYVKFDRLYNNLFEKSL